MSNFLQRTIFGSIYVAVIVLSCLFWQPYLLGGVFLAVSVLATLEYCNIMQVDKRMKVEYAMLSALMFVVGWAASCHPFTCDLIDDKSVGFFIAFTVSGIVSLFVLLYMILAEIFLSTHNPMENWGKLLFSQFWIAIPFGIMGYVGAQQPMLLLAMFVIIWVNDTGAYCVGSLIGKHKMIPSVSPGKSWEGLIGGFVFALGAGYIFFADPFGFTGLQLNNWAMTTFLIAGLGTLGDLLESRLKRFLGIKDSGKAIPGHGGWLDRFDSALMAAFVLLFALIDVMAS